MPTRSCKYQQNVWCPEENPPTDKYCVTCMMQSEKKSDNKISHPAHYCEGRKFEPKDVIRDWGLNYNLGCTVKYISRAGRKDDILQDLRKAKQYLEFEIEALEKETVKEVTYYMDDEKIYMTARENWHEDHP